MNTTQITIILSLLISLPIFGQRYVLDSIMEVHPDLVNLEANHFIHADSSRYFQNFFQSLDSVYEGKKEKIHIFHIGGSHIQADIYSNRMRTYLQSSGKNTMAQRGFVFPFDLANTNNPANYKITSAKGNWKGIRNSIKRDTIAWGLSGITAVFSDTQDTLCVEANNKSYTGRPYKFNKFRLFCNTWADCYQVQAIDTSLVESVEVDSQNYFMEYKLKEAVAYIELKVAQTDSIPSEPFLMMGMEFMNDEPGIEYTSIGVNGADFPSYARSAYFEKQLRLYHPELFIISMGTNDTYKPASRFDPEKFRSDYVAFIEMVKRVNPECAILLTVPNDSYYRRRYANPNTVKAEEIILELAKEYDMAVWNFYQVMGGFKSSQKWYRKGLMPRDRIHFTRKGYHIKSDLLMKAFVTEWEEATGREPDSMFHTILENAYE